MSSPISQGFGRTDEDLDLWIVEQVPYLYKHLFTGFRTADWNILETTSYV